MKPQPNDWRRVYDAAASFAQASDLLHQQNTAAFMRGGEGFRVPLLAPAVVCSAFSVELFLKCLALVENGGMPRGHSLKTLFSKLAPTSQAAVSRRFAELAAASPNLQALRVIGPGVSLSLDSVLEAVDKVFEHWRYHFEGEAASAYGLAELRQALRERIDDGRPNPEMEQTASR